MVYFCESNMLEATRGSCPILMLAPYPNQIQDLASIVQEKSGDHDIDVTDLPGWRIPLPLQKSLNNMTFISFHNMLTGL